MTEAQPTHVGHIIEMSGGAQAQYLDEKTGRDFAHPFSAWTTDREKATVYETVEQAEAILEKPLAHVAPFCKVVAK